MHRAERAPCLSTIMHVTTAKALGLVHPLTGHERRALLHRGARLHLIRQPVDLASVGIFQQRLRCCRQLWQIQPRRRQPLLNEPVELRRGDISALRLSAGIHRFEVQSRNVAIVTLSQAGAAGRLALRVGPVCGPSPIGGRDCCRASQSRAVG